LPHIKERKEVGKTGIKRNKPTVVNKKPVSSLGYWFFFLIHGLKKTMSKELVVQTNDKEVVVTILENGKLLEIHRQSNDQNFLVGDIYLGRIKKIAEGLNAAFVNIGCTKDAFLHYHDLGPQLKSFLKFLSLNKSAQQSYDNQDYTPEEQINKDGYIGEVLQSGQKILIQITKESISNKGPRLTSEISLAGRYLILIAFADKISVSQKIKDRKERERLISLMQRIKPKGFGIIIRTVASNKKTEALEADLLYLINKWKNTLKNLRKKNPPARVMREMDKASLILRDLFNDDFTSIICDDEDLCDEMTDYLSTIAPDKIDIVKHYRDKDLPIFEKFGIERQMKVLLGKNVPLAKGAYLVIEHTEALHVIDVNSGMGAHIKNKQENVALDVNILAASEIARQLRLRDMGGIIVIDFIDMSEAEHRKKLYEHLKEEMKNERAKYKILPPSKFGLIQLTRQRVRPELNIETSEENPNKNDEVEAPTAHIYRLEFILENFIKEKHKSIILYTHPFIAAYLKQGWPSRRQKWFLKHKKWIKIIPRDSFKYLEYQIVDRDNKILSAYKN